MIQREDILSMEYLKKTEPEYYPPVENLLDLIYEHYTENNPVEKNTVAGKAAKAKEKELEASEKRIAELSAIFKRLYEDSVTGRISDERITNLKYRVKDLRLFSENDVRFLQQFEGC